MNKEIQSLVDQLNAASDAYYNGRDELMTDYEWDAAFAVACISLRARHIFA